MGVFGFVPHYISLMNWTSPGISGLPAWRERVDQGEREIAEAGGKLVGVYVTMGPYDVVEIFEAPDDATAAGTLVRLARFAGAAHSQARRLFTRAGAEALLRRRW